HPDTSAVAAPPVAQQALTHLPLTFAQNAGQTDPSVQYLAHGPGYTLFLGSTDTTLLLPRPQTVPTNPTPPVPDALRLHLVGARPDTLAAGQDLLPGKANYFLGNDPSAWRTNIATYGQVVLPNVYPGIDLSYAANARQQLEYTFTVHPGA